MIHERLIKKRKEAGLTQAELARRIGVGRDSYNRYERSGTNPSLETLSRIAIELCTSTDYLLGNSDNPTLPGQCMINKDIVKETFYETSSPAIEAESIVEENQSEIYNIGGYHAVIKLDAVELSLITDFRDIDESAKNDLCRMAKTLAENARLKRILKE